MELMTSRAMIITATPTTMGTGENALRGLGGLLLRPLPRLLPDSLRREEALPEDRLCPPLWPDRDERRRPDLEDWESTAPNWDDHGNSRGRSGGRAFPPRSPRRKIR